MIVTLNDLIAHTERQAAAEPLIASDILLRSPGLSAEEIARLRTSLPGLPEGYLRTASLIDLTTVSIGPFSLQPSLIGGSGLADRLVAANSPFNRFWPALCDHKLYEVAGYDGDPLCVVATGQTNTGAVVRLDKYADDVTRAASPIASSFEVFMIAAGRLDEMRSKGELGRAAQDRFLASLADLGIEGEAVKNWRWFTEDVLEDSEATEP